MRRIRPWLLGLATLFAASTALAAEVRVMISAGFFGVYSELAPAFEKASGHKAGLAPPAAK